MNETMQGEVSQTTENTAPVTEAQDEISISELMGNQSAEKAADAPAPEQKPQREISTQKDFQTALSKQREADRKALRSDPAYQLAERLVKERMASDQVTREEAVKRIAEDGIKQKAATFKEKPEEAFEYLLRKIEQPNSEPEPKEADESTDAFSAAQEVLASGQMNQEGIRKLGQAVRAAIESGILPGDFDPKTDATQDFFNDWAEFGINAAARILVRTRGSTSKIDETKAQIEQRREEPKPIRTTGESTGRGEVDVSKMSDAEFKAFRQKLMTKAESGVTVRP